MFKSNQSNYEFCECLRTQKYLASLCITSFAFCVFLLLLTRQMQMKTEKNRCETHHKQLNEPRMHAMQILS